MAVQPLNERNSGSRIVSRIVVSQQVHWQTDLMGKWTQSVVYKTPGLSQSYVRSVSNTLEYLYYPSSGVNPLLNFGELLPLLIDAFLPYNSTQHKKRWTCG